MDWAVAEAEIVREQWPELRVEIIENTSHALFVDEPQQFNRMLEEFIAALPEATTNLARAEVLQIAEATARSEGYDVSKYNMTACHYEFTRKDHTWTVFYELKPPAPPGGHFMVSIDDQTKKASLAHGE